MLVVPKDHQDIHKKDVDVHVFDGAQEDAVDIQENKVNP